MLPAMAREHHHGRAFRRRELVCGRVAVTVVRDDDRLGLAPRERCYVLARFVGDLDPELREELHRLVHRRGAAARRIAETLEPVELVFAGSDGAEYRITARIEPPIQRSGHLHAIEFGLRERDRQSGPPSDERRRGDHGIQPPRRRNVDPQSIQFGSRDRAT
jgi:hypothetical protein